MASRRRAATRVGHDGRRKSPGTNRSRERSCAIWICNFFSEWVVSCQRSAAVKSRAVSADQQASALAARQVGLAVRLELGFRSFAFRSEVVRPEAGTRNRACGSLGREVDARSCSARKDRSTPGSAELLECLTSAVALFCFYVSTGTRVTTGKGNVGSQLKSVFPPTVGRPCSRLFATGLRHEYRSECP